MKLKQIMRILGVNRDAAIRFMDRNKFKFTTEPVLGGRARFYKDVTEADILAAKEAEELHKGSGKFSNDAATDLFNLIHR